MPPDVAAAIVDIFVYVVVLNLFVEYLPQVISELVTLSLLTAVLLKGVLEVVVRLKKRVGTRFRQASTGREDHRRFLLWAVLFGSKFLVWRPWTSCLVLASAWAASSPSPCSSWCCCCHEPPSADSSGETATDNRLIGSGRTLARPTPNSSKPTPVRKPTLLRTAVSEGSASHRMLTLNHRVARDGG